MQLNSSVITSLLKSEDPSIRYILSRDVLGINHDTDAMKSLRQEIKTSPRVKAMLEPRDKNGRFPWHAYNKWRGAFWTLLQLVDLGYPPGDESLVPLREQVLEWLLDPDRLKKIPLINGRYRRCALQEASAVYSLLKLDLADERVDQLVELLLKWQWPDGGWNCDKKPEASHSSFHETWIPLRAMYTYAVMKNDPKALAAAERASEVFLSRRLFRRLSDGEEILKNFTLLAFPQYWHYDILAGLMVMSDVGKLMDPRCREALDLLESKQLPDGGFPAETRYYAVTDRDISGVSPVAWGPVSKVKMNEFVTVRALAVLKKAGRF